MYAIELKNIEKHFNNVVALQNINLSIKKGETLAIVGDNGAGKSTLIKIIAGSLRPSSGTIHINGTEVNNMTPKLAMKLGISTVFQDLALAGLCTVSENIFLGLEKKKLGIFLNKKEMDKEAAQLISQLNINIPDINTYTENLSGGQKQGVAIARAIKQGGHILILDEPTAAMGYNESQKTVELIKSLKNQGFTIIIISHNLPQVFEISDEICVLRHGSIAAVKKTSESNINQIVSLITGKGEQ